MLNFALSIVETIRHPLLILDHHFTIVTANSPFYQAFDLSPEEVLGCPLYELDGQRWNKPQIRDLMQKLVSENDYFEDLEIEYDSPRTGPRVMALNARRVVRTEDQMPSILLAMEDQTERHRTRNQLRFLFDSSPHPMWVYELKTLRFLEVNETALRHYGYTRAQFLQMTIRDIRPPEDIPRIEAVLAALEPGDEYVGLWRHRTASGKLIQAELTARAVNLDGVPACIVLAQDVTARLEAEEESRRTAELLRAISDNTTDAVFVKDRESRYLLFNPAAARFVGRPVEDVLGQDDAALFDPEGAKFVMDRDRRIMETGITETAEELLTAGGVTRTYLATKAPLRDSEGTVVGLIGVSRDITERKQMEEALRISEARFRAFMNNSPASSWITDIHGRFLFANSSYARTCGVEASKLLGRKLSEFFPPEHVEIYLQNIHTVVETGKVLEVVEPAQRADGTTGEFLIYKFPIVDSPGKTVVGGIAVDITQHREMEEALRLRDRAIGASTQGIMIIDTLQPDLPIIYVSPGLERLTGCPSEAVVGKPCCEFLQGPQTDPKTIAQLCESINAGKACTIEIFTYRNDGTTFWNHLALSPVRDADGRLTHFVGVQSDVTERRELEEQFQHSQKMEAVGKLAGGVAHDFNNLLTIINGFTEVLLESTSPEEAAWDYLQEIRKAGERSTNLTRQLLAFSRRQIVSPEVLDLNDLIRESESMLRTLIGENIELTTILFAEPLFVKADPGQLQQVVMNLAVNARDAMPNGGWLTLETQSVEFQENRSAFSAEIAAGRYVMLAVSDTGCGMEPSVLPHIFEPFFTTKAVGSGTGLGLSVVHGIVKQAGGTLDVSSEVGMGTTFKILLPRLESEVSPKSTDKKIEARSLPPGNETILLIEDEPSVRELTKHVLEGCGYTVLDAASGAEATRYLDTFIATFSEPIHLLVTDVVMPQESGPQIVERILQQFPEIRVLFMSGYTDDTVLRHGILNTEVNFLQKPFTSTALATKVRAVLDRP